MRPSNNAISIKDTAHTKKRGQLNVRRHFFFRLFFWWCSEMPWPTLRSAITRILLKGRKINNISGQCSYSRLIRSATVIFPLILFFFLLWAGKGKSKRKKRRKVHRHNFDGVCSGTAASELCGRIG